MAYPHQPKKKAAAVKTRKGKKKVSDDESFEAERSDEDSESNEELDAEDRKMVATYIKNQSKKKVQDPLQYLTKVSSGGVKKSKGTAKAAAKGLLPSQNQTQTQVITSPAAPKILTVQRHLLTSGQTVKLAPRVRVGNDGTIRRVDTGRMRPPSPFGARMGDHTGAWTTVVDDVRALMHGKTVAQAYAALQQRQAEAQAWMTQPGSLGMKLWESLEESDRNKRQPVLETYAAEVRDALQGPPTAEGLGKAIAHHLAYLNFLPYATVPAKGVIPSKGAGEGAARTAALVLDQRAEVVRRRGPETDQQRVQREAAEQDRAARMEAAKRVGETQDETRERNAREADRELNILPNAARGLWNLFSFDAATREARADRVVAPAEHQKVVNIVSVARKLGGLATELTGEFGMASVGKGKSVPDWNTSYSKEGFLDIADQLKSLSTQVATLPPTGFQAVGDLATNIGWAADKMADTVKELNQKTDDTKEVMRYGAQITKLNQNLDSLLASLGSDPGTVEDEVALILGGLLHEHQARVARAYPVAAGHSGFLQPNPTDAAVAKLREHLLGQQGADLTAVDRLLGKVAAVHTALGPILVPPPNSWVAEARTADVVATFPTPVSVTIQGRPGAPSGVEGMGSHTTAWVTEVQAVEKMVAQVGKAGIVQRLKDEALQNLNGEVMTRLAAVLPAEQLDAGQLGDIFDAALAVMQTEDPEDAVATFLSFRNLLPYATVDAGDRLGHGESRTADIKDLFDDVALDLAMGAKEEEYKPDNLARTVGSLEGAAHTLRTILVETLPLSAGEEPPSWHTHPDIKAVVEKAANALDGEAGRTRQAAGTGYAAAGVKEVIFNARVNEHERVFAAARVKV